jgi:exonuclease III
MLAISWNVGGLGDHKKRSLVWKNIKDYSTQHKSHNIIWALQETHSTPSTIKKWKLELGVRWSIVFSHGTSASRGVWLLSNSITLSPHHQDNDGRIIIASFTFNNQSFKIASIYAPADSHTSRATWLGNQLWNNWEDESIILGGDWNTVTEASGKDSTFKSWKPARDSNILVDKLDLHSFVDAWKIHGNPLE